MSYAIVLVCLLYQFTKNTGLLNVLILKMNLKLVCFLSLLLSLSLLKVLTPEFLPLAPSARGKEIRKGSFISKDKGRPKI